MKKIQTISKGLLLKQVSSGLMDTGEWSEGVRETGEEDTFPAQFISC